LKLDLHTHIHEATNVAHPDVELVRRIITRINERGLDGIAITEHRDKNYAYQVIEIINRFFANQVIIIPGQEVGEALHHVVELYLPDGSTFRFVAHPENGELLERCFKYFNNIHGMEIENGGYHIDKEKVMEIAQRYDLLLLSNSDAHALSDIGRYYNEIDLEELSARAKRGRS
jgi:hypothetical protein